MMMRQVLASSRYVILIAVVTTFAASVALLSYQAIAIFSVIIDSMVTGSVTITSAKPMAAGIIEMMDVFLIAIVAYIMSVGLYSLFIDDTLPLPRWLKVADLEELKNHLVSVVIVVLAVLFLREAVERAPELDLLKLGASLSLMIAALTFFSMLYSGKRR